jgi:hypothetical protein
MGYEIRITRKENEPRLTLKDWLDYVTNDDEFFFKNDIPDYEDSYPDYYWKVGSEYIPFDFEEKYGAIYFKNPEVWAIEKMVFMAEKMNALVVGDDGEIYDWDFIDREPLSKRIYPAKFEWKKVLFRKKWWQFWK